MKKFAFMLTSGFFLLAYCSKAQQPADVIPIHDSLSIQSQILGELRKINVWTPPQYNTHAHALPVMYMPDGGINEDFPHVANTMAELISAKAIPPMILVGIENTQRRRDLTGPTEVAADKKIAPIVGGAAAFRNFIKEELFPEINKRYRTNNKKGIIGESLAGLFVMETFFLEPGMFDFYIAFDPSLWWNNHYLVRTAKENLSKLSVAPKVLWFAGSGTKDISTYTRKLNKILEQNNYSGLKWAYSDEPKEKHNTIFRATKVKALMWAMNED